MFFFQHQDSDTNIKETANREDDIFGYVLESDFFICSRRCGQNLGNKDGIMGVLMEKGAIGR